VPFITGVAEGAMPVAFSVPDVPDCPTPDLAPSILALSEGAAAVAFIVPSVTECASGAIELGPYED
jgi:hypothetical protein